MSSTAELTKHVIVYTIDDNSICLSQLEMSIRSVRHFLGHLVQIIICTTHPDKVKHLDADTIIDVTATVASYGFGETKAYWHGHKCSPMMLYRLALPVTPELNEFDEVLYLDSDTEIWDERAISVFDLPNDDVDIVGFVDHAFKKIPARVSALRDYCKTAWAECKRTEELLRGDYLNSGVLLFNLKRMRTRTNPDEFLRHVMSVFNEQPPRFPDQEIINLLYDVRAERRFEFNWWPGIDESVPRYIRHYVGRHYNTQWDNLWRPKALDSRMKASVSGISDICDRTTVLCCTSCKERASGMERELRRIGLSADFLWQFPTPYDEYVIKDIPHTREFGNVKFISNWFGHYRAIKTAYELGCESLLVIEDDCRFLLDTEKLDEIVRDLPGDYDLALLDHFYCKWDETGKANYERMCQDKISEFWSPFSGDLYSAACYLVSRRLMERSIWLHESILDPTTYKRMMRITDNWHNSGVLGAHLRLYFCSPNAAIQRNVSGDPTRMSNTGKINRNYELAGLNLADYAL